MLPVAYASLEPGADVDAMFRLGESPKYSLLDLRQKVPFAELFQLGQFGVDYCAAVHMGQQPQVQQSLRKGIMQADYSGVMILDVAGDSDYLPAVLAVADLVLVPVKDPAALPAVVALQKALLAADGNSEQLWLLPSQLGEESGYQQQAKLEEFLRFAAQERGFQVLDELLSADPQVANLAVRLAKPVLTRVPQSALHQQLKQVAELLLESRQQLASSSVRIRRMLLEGLLPPRVKRITTDCPLCGQPALSGEVYYLEASPSRRRLLLHSDCATLLLRGTGAVAFHDKTNLALLQSAALFGGCPGPLRLRLVSELGELLNTEAIGAAENPAWCDLTQAATGRCLAELYHESFVLSGPLSVVEVFTDYWYQGFVVRRRALRTACQQEQI